MTLSSHCCFGSASQDTDDVKRVVLKREFSFGHTDPEHTLLSIVISVVGYKE
jgi:hypothetical protein